MRRIGIFLLALVMAASVLYGVAVSAEQSVEDIKYEEAYAVLAGLGILNPDTQNDPNMNLTVVEFAEMVTTASGGINLNNLIDSLNSYVTNDAAIRLIVAALGYNYNAQKMGGFPVGYTIIAVQNGILKNTSFKGGDTASLRDLTVLLYNALSVDLMENLGGGEFKVMKGTTFLTNIEKIQEIKIVTGQVIATSVSSLVGASALSKTNQVNIDGVVYDVSQNVSYTKLLGRLVIAFVKTDNDIKKIYSISPRVGKNAEKKLYAKDIVSYADFRYEYEDERGISRYLTVPKSVNVVYNGMGLGNIAAKDLNALNGTLTLLDTQNTGEWDVLFIDEYKDYLVSGVDKENEIITFRQNAFEPKWSLDIKSDYVGYNYFILNSKDDSPLLKEYKPEDLPLFSPNDAVTIFESKDRQTVTLALSDENFEGVISEMDYTRGKVIVEGKEYSLSRYSGREYLVPESDLRVGEKGVFYLNAYGEIVCVDTQRGVSDTQYIEKSSSGYAYVIDARVKSGISQEMQLRLLRGNVLRDPEKDEMEENDLSTSHDSNTTELTKKQVYGQRVEVGKCASTVLFAEGDLDSSRVSSDKLTNLKGRMIEYATNSDGLITKITAYSGDERERKFVNEFNIFTNATADGAFMADNKTVFFVVPSSAITDEDYEVRYTIVDTGYYKTTPFNLQRNFSSDFDVAGMCLIKSSVNGHRPGLITDNTPISVIDRVSQALNDEGEITTKVYAYTSGVYKGYLMRASTASSAPKPGDVVKLSIDGDGNIDKFILYINAGDNSLPFFRIGARTTNERIFGTVYDKREDVIQGLTGKVVKQIDVSHLVDYSEIFIMDISTLLEKQMYLYDRAKGSFSLAKYTDIMTCMASGDAASKVFLYINSGNIRGLVIIK